MINAALTVPSAGRSRGRMQSGRRFRLRSLHTGARTAQKDQEHIRMRGIAYKTMPAIQQMPHGRPQSQGFDSWGG